MKAKNKTWLMVLAKKSLFFSCGSIFVFCFDFAIW